MNKNEILSIVVALCIFVVILLCAQSIAESQRKFNEFNRVAESYNLY